MRKLICHLQISVGSFFWSTCFSMNSFSVSIVFKNLVLVKNFIFYFSVPEFEREEEKSQKKIVKEKKSLDAMIIVIKRVDHGVNMFYLMRVISSVSFLTFILNSKIDLEFGSVFKIWVDFLFL